MSSAPEHMAGHPEAEGGAPEEKDEGPVYQLVKVWEGQSISQPTLPFLVGAFKETKGHASPFSRVQHFEAETIYIYIYIYI